jgi:hypothetical protein
VIRNLLAVIAVINIGGGVWMLVDPQGVISWVLEVQGSGAYEGELSLASLGELRAVSGLITMLGVVILRALWSLEFASWLQPLAWCFLGISLARLSSLLLEGGFSTYTFAMGLIEATTAWLLGIHSQRQLLALEEEDDEEYDDEEYEEDSE